MYRILTVEYRYDKQPYDAKGVFLPAVSENCLYLCNPKTITVIKNYTTSFCPKPLFIINKPINSTE
jgi:hypothetical protein